MAVYIDDGGTHSFDALFIGVEDTAWSKSTTDECVWFSSTGTCETGFILPDTEWIVYEVYGMTGVTADYTTLTGSTQLHGKKEYTTTIGTTILTTLNAWRTAYDTSKGSDYTTYEIIATHYKGSDLADVYEADETTAFTTARTTDGDFTGHGSEWTLSDTLLSDSVTSFGIERISNGTFDTVVTPWTPSHVGDVTLTVDTQRMKITNELDVVYLNARAPTWIDAADTTYRCWITVEMGTSSLVSVYFPSEAITHDITTDGDYVFDINTTSGTQQLRVYNETGLTYCFIDNVSVKEIL